MVSLVSRAVSRIGIPAILWRQGTYWHLIYIICWTKKYNVFALCNIGDSDQADKHFEHWADKYFVTSLLIISYHTWYSHTLKQMYSGKGNIFLWHTTQQTKYLELHFVWRDVNLHPWLPMKQGLFDILFNQSPIYNIFVICALATQTYLTDTLIFCQ